MTGNAGDVALPVDEEVCAAAVQEFREYRANLAQQFAELAATRTNDQRAREAIVRTLERKALYWRPDEGPE